MKMIIRCLLMLLSPMTVCRADLMPTELEKEIRSAFGPEWTVAVDFEGIVAVHRDAKLLPKIGRNSISRATGEEWADALSTDYRISIVWRPKLSAAEYRRLDALRADLVAERGKIFSEDKKTAYGERKRAEAVIDLPEFYVRDKSVYFSSTGEGDFEVRPQGIMKCEEKVLAILKEHCQSYGEARKTGEK